MAWLFGQILIAAVVSIVPAIIALKTADKRDEEIPSGKWGETKQSILRNVGSAKRFGYIAYGVSFVVLLLFMLLS